MSTSPISGMVQSGLLAQLVADNTATQAQVDKLTEQASSGKVADTFGGLGSAASVSIDLRPEMAHISAWQQNISTAGTTLDTTQSTLSQLASIASTFSADALGTAMQDATGVEGIATEASTALQQVVSMLNATDANGQYTFAGTDSANPPISATDLASFESDVASQVGGLSTGTDPATLLANLVSDGSTADFAYPGSSASGTTPAATTTTVGQNAAVPTAFVAGVNSYGTSSGTTTGSYVRDLITGLSALAGLSNTSADDTTLQSFGTQLAQLFDSATGAIATEEAGFGAVQSNLTQSSTQLSDTLTSLTTQVSGVEDVNMTATATALSQVQTQLQASYQLIANMKQLTLTAYL